MVQFLVYKTKEGIIEYTTFLERELITDKFIEIFETCSVIELKERIKYLMDKNIQGEPTYIVETLKKKNKVEEENKSDSINQKKQKKYYQMIKEKKLEKLKQNLKSENIISSLKLSSSV